MKKLLFMLLAFCVLCGCSKDSDNNDEDNIQDTSVNQDAFSSQDTSISQDKPNSNVDGTKQQSDDYVGVWFTKKTGNYMDIFLNPEMFELYFREIGTPAIIIQLCSHTEGQNGGAWYAYDSDDDATVAKYNECARYFGDTSYTWYHDMSPFQRASLKPLNSISIVADKDIDEDHPAGTSLNDLFTVKYRAFHSFIKNEYENEIDENHKDDPMDSVVVVSDFKGASLFQDGAEFVLTKQPSEKGAYVFTFTLDFGADPLTGEKVEVPSASIEVEF